MEGLEVRLQGSEEKIRSGEAEAGSVDKGRTLMLGALMSLGLR